MKRRSIGQRALRFGALAVLVGACASFAPSQDPTAAPEYETINVKVGFSPDPVVVKVAAGGTVMTEIGGFKHWVAVKPDVRLIYTASDLPVGKYVLTIYADCDHDATLLIRLPDGKWVANDNGPNAGNNPVLRFASPLTTPQAGVYDIWVGMIDGTKTPPARLFITELKK